MHLDEKTRQKLADYSQKKIITKSDNFNLETDFEDIITWMVKDIVNKIVLKNINQETKNKINSQDFHESIYRQILGNSINLIVEEDGLIENDEMHSLKETQDLNEMLVKLVILTELNEKISEKIIKSIITSYLGKCLEFGVVADEYIAAVIMS